MQKSIAYHRKGAKYKRIGRSEIALQFEKAGIHCILYLRIKAHLRIHSTRLVGGY